MRRTALLLVALAASGALVAPVAPAFALPVAPDDTSPLHDPIMDGEFEMDGTWNPGEFTQFVDVDGDLDREALIPPNSPGLFEQGGPWLGAGYGADFNRLIVRVERGTIPHDAYLYLQLATGTVRPRASQWTLSADCELVVPASTFTGVNVILVDPAAGHLIAREDTCVDEVASFTAAATEARRRAILENLVIGLVQLNGLTTGAEPLVLDGVRMSDARPLPLELVSEARSTDASDAYATILDPLDLRPEGIQPLGGFYEISAWVRSYDGTQPAPTVDLSARAGHSAVVRFLSPTTAARALSEPWTLASCEPSRAGELVQCGVIGDAGFVLETDEVVRVRVPVAAVEARGLSGDAVAIALFLDVEDGRFEATMGAAPYQPGAGWYHPAKLALQGLPIASSFDATPQVVTLLAP